MPALLLRFEFFLGALAGGLAHCVAGSRVFDQLLNVLCECCQLSGLDQIAIACVVDDFGYPRGGVGDNRQATSPSVYP